MAGKKRSNEAKVITGIPLPLDRPEIPDSWMPEDDFSSHRPMLYRAITNTAHSAFIEFGTGMGSTPLLKEYYNNWREKDFISHENNYEWYMKMKGPGYTNHLVDNLVTHHNHSLFYSKNLIGVNIWQGTIVFIDCAPAELRKELISKHSGTAKLIIVHDTEPGAEYVYGLNDILSSFKFRCDLIVEGSPQTTVISNLYEFNNWKTYVNDKISFI